MSPGDGLISKNKQGPKNGLVPNKSAEWSSFLFVSVNKSTKIKVADQHLSQWDQNFSLKLEVMKVWQKKTDKNLFKKQNSHISRVLPTMATPVEPAGMETSNNFDLMVCIYTSSAECFALITHISELYLKIPRKLQE